MNPSPNIFPTHRDARPDDAYPVHWLPIGQLDNRWSEGSPDHKAGGQRLLALYRKISSALAVGGPPPEAPPGLHTRYAAVKDIFDDLHTIGLRNPLIVFPVKERYLVLMGNQRLTALRGVAGVEEVPCRIAPAWRAERQVMLAHPPEAILPIEQLDYRWAEGTLDVGHGQRLLNSFPEVIRHLKAGTVPQERTIFRYYETARAVAQSIEEHGLANPLLVYQVAAGERYLVLIGNQRLLLGRVWDWPRLPCRITTEWNHDLLKQFPPVKVDMPWPM